MTRRCLPILLLAACGEPAAPAAPDADLTPVIVEGTVFAVVDMAIGPLEGAAVELRDRDDDAVLAEATSGADGAFALSAVGAPIDGYVTAAGEGRLRTVAYPARPLTGDEHVLLIAAAADEVGAWHDAVGDTYAPAERVVITATVDDANDPIAGSTVAFAPAPATLTYYDDVGRAWNPALTASTNGFALATGVAGSVTITAHDGEAALAPHTIEPGAGELTLVVLTGLR